MIHRLQLLRNIGQFDSVDTGANIPLARLTFIYSENGRGKTTLAAVLRSLATGDCIPIMERRRLAAVCPPHVVLECRGGPPAAVFKNNAWNRTLSDIVIFDDVFIDQNIYSGLVVQSHHRQNLHELILGTKAMILSKRLQDLVKVIEDHNKELRAKERAIPASTRGPFTVNEYCNLPPQPDVDQRILEAERALAAGQEKDAICQKPFFTSLSLPEFDLADVERLLQKDLPALDSTSLIQIQEHFEKLGKDGEAWVSDGMTRIPQDEGDAVTPVCPFCAQDLQGSTVLRHYRAYFSNEYTGLKSKLSDALGRIDQAHGGDASAVFERVVRITGELRQFWSRFCEVTEFTLDTAEIVRDWRSARDAVLEQLSTKQAAPLERMRLSAETRALVKSYQNHRVAIASINKQLQDDNLAIGVVKEQATDANLAVLSNDLARCRAIKARHIPEIAALCDNYVQELNAKSETEHKRDQARADLDQHRKNVFPGFQSTINQYLLKFNAGFRLDSVNYANTRGGPTCIYDVIINKTPVPIRNVDFATGEPAFRNTLSAGDRNTLALAFFFASLDQDADLASKVIVIDDPISSLDEHRALTTVQEIRRLAERAAQVIVLSHNKAFLCRLWEGADSTMRAALKIVRDSAGSTLRLWDVSQDSITEHDRRHTLLRDYFTINIGDVREVARAIRPHLESFLRVACPENFRPGTLLGPFLNLCDQRHGTSQEMLENDAIQELRAIVDYANGFHHDTNPAWETQSINEGELMGFVERTLKFARR